MNRDLTKSEKKTARAIIEKGLQKEFESSILKLDAIIEQWKNQIIDNRSAYHSLYSSMQTSDKHIAKRYDYMKGSKYLMIIIGQLIENVITEEDLGEFPQDIKEYLKK